MTMHTAGDAYAASALHFQEVRTSSTEEARTTHHEEIATQDGRMVDGESHLVRLRKAAC